MNRREGGAAKNGRSGPVILRPTDPVAGQPGEPGLTSDSGSIRSARRESGVPLFLFKHLGELPVPRCNRAPSGFVVICLLCGHGMTQYARLASMEGAAQAGFDDKLPEILAISRKMNSERDLGALLDLIAREATSLLHCDRASIFLLDREKHQLWSKVALGSDLILRFDAAAGIVGHAVQTGEIVNVGDAYSDPRFYHGIDERTGYRTRNVLAVAVRNERGEIIGAFEVLNKRSGAFHQWDEESLTALAAHAGIAI